MRTAQDDYIQVGLKSWRGEPPPMARPHWHSEIELNFVQQGAITYLHRDTSATIHAGCLAAFWAAIPHQLLGCADGTRYYFLTLPLDLFLTWKLPQAFTQALLLGDMLIDDGRADGSFDSTLFQHWHTDLITDRSFVALMEIEARLWRFALTTHPTTPTLIPAQSLAAHTKASQMAKFIVEHYAEPLTVQAIADQVALHPNYAMQLFKKAFRMSLLTYVTQYRVTQAQRLLVTTNETVLNVAMQVGFGSNSNFYAAFKKYSGQPPNTYRQTLVMG